MTERMVQDALFRNLAKASQVALPHYTPAGWWECDFFSVTKAGYFHEHEIKLTAADFRRDAEKRRRLPARWIEGKWIQDTGATKHELLINGDSCGPVCFYYCLPYNLVPLEQIPSFAGVKWINNLGSRARLSPARSAPRLHSIPVATTIITHAFSVCFWRFWNERLSRRAS